MHRRKQFLIYPANYQPGDGYKVRHSKLQAWKVAVRMGVGASVDVAVHIHPGRCKGWISSSGYGLWGPLTLKTDNVELTGSGATTPVKENAAVPLSG